MNIGNVELVCLEQPRRSLPLSEEQQQIVDALKSGWLLFQDKYTHEFYMKAVVPPPPFRALRGNVYKRSADALVKAGVIRPHGIALPSRDKIFVLKEDV
jgi:hypothetical protein